MEETLLGRSDRRRTGRTGFLMTAAVFTLVAVCVAVAGLWESDRRRTQMQNDPRVARVWVVGTTFGARHEIQRGSTLQQWLNSHHISLLGDYEMLRNTSANDPSGLEIWFNYESYLIGLPDLECHRINPAGTAFVDDLGQPYHGYLDIHGKTVAVYLPGYDHAAHEIRCVVKWMPRRPATGPVSRPMVFTIKLPRAARTLPPASTLPRTVSLTKNGVTVTVDAARLGPFKYATTGYIGQHDLTFHLKINGGEIADDNMVSGLNLAIADPGRASRINTIIGSLPQRLRIFSGRMFNGDGLTQRRLRLPIRQSGPQRKPFNRTGLAQRQLQAFVMSSSSFETPMTLTDPYGISLVVPGQSITPIVSKEMVERARRGEGLIWTAPVIGAGKGTDVVRIHIDVLPTPQPGQHPSALKLVPFDLCVPVQTGDEI